MKVAPIASVEQFHDGGEILEQRQPSNAYVKPDIIQEWGRENQRLAMERALQENKRLCSEIKSRGGSEEVINKNGYGLVVPIR